MIIDHDRVASVIIEIAEEEIAPRFGKLSEKDIDTKTSPTDFVTAADLAAEMRLQKALHDIYPAAAFIGEETVAKNPKSLDLLGEEGAFWIVDPLDGTRNFVQGREEFGTIVALVEDGEIRAGWIYAIPDQSMAQCLLGDGVSWAGTPVSPLNQTERAISGFRAIGALGEEWRRRVEPNLRAKFDTHPARCSAYAYISLVTGQRDFSLYSRIQPWDHAAGILMVNEIGGKAAYLDDNTLYAPIPHHGRPLLVANTKQAWSDIRDAIL